MRKYELSPRFDGAQSFYRKAHVIQVDNVEILESYDTPVMQMHADGRLELLIDVDGWAFSATTQRHIREWLKQHGYKDILPLKKFLKDCA